MAISAHLVALRLLTARRLSESQLWKKLEVRGYPDEAIAATVDRCKRDGYLDDRLFATLYVEGPRKAVGDARLIAELVKRGIDRSVASNAVAQAALDQSARLEAAYAMLRRKKAGVSYPSAARALERLGFPTALIYRALRKHASAAFPGLEPMGMVDRAS